jgi:hypothetical protein
MKQALLVIIECQRKKVFWIITQSVSYRNLKLSIIRQIHDSPAILNILILPLVLGTICSINGAALMGPYF